MSIKQTYLEYLQHFGKTSTISEMYHNRETTNMVGLRHDVDYDIDIALEMAYWEREYGQCSTYYLLHTAPYWQDDRFLDKCLQLQDFGHEVGLHVNVLTEWMQGKIDDVGRRLSELLTPLHEAGIQVIGASAHGDKACYKKQYINYWCFEDLRPADATTEHGKSAEGIPVSDARFQIQYPATHQLMREDGQALPLWQLKLSEYGLAYMASHVPYDQYYTDSGGSWTRSMDPMETDLSRGRHQVLIHPIYWRGEKKMYFFLSTARSGSKWLTTILDKATSLQAKHEFTLNHRYTQNELRMDKRTGHGFTALMKNEDDVRHLMREARAYIEDSPQDYGEANVYLAHLLPIMNEIFPDAIYIHLHRDPKDVVRSIMNREWYDVPEDYRHPSFMIDGWENMTQFEKACWYVRLTNETILEMTSNRMPLEEITSSMSVFAKRCKKLGIPFYPRLASPIFAEIVNKNKASDFPPYAEWTNEERELYHQICDPICDTLAYQIHRDSRLGTCEPNKLWSRLRTCMMLHNKTNRAAHQYTTRSILALFSSNSFQIDHLGHRGCTLNIDRHLLIITPNHTGNVYVMLGGGQWHVITKEQGWEPIIPYYFRGSMDAEAVDGYVDLFVLSYGHDGKLIEKKSLGKLRGVKHDFSFRVKSNVSRFNIAIYMNKDHLPAKLCISRIAIEAVPLHAESVVLR